MSNRFEYIGSHGIGYDFTDDMKAIFNMNGNSINGDNPYNNIVMMGRFLNTATLFGYDQFINNVLVLPWMDLDDNCMFYHDPDNECWIAYMPPRESYGYHGYHVFV